MTAFYVQLASLYRPGVLNSKSTQTKQIIFTLNADRTSIQSRYKYDKYFR